MQLGLRALAVISATLFLVSFNDLQAQTTGQGWVAISGSVKGPLYPCGNSSCPTYDSGKVTITVNGFSAETNYSYSTGQNTTEAIATSLVSQLNAAASPVTAVRSSGKVVMTVKQSNQSYPLSTQVTHSTIVSTLRLSLRRLRVPLWVVVAELIRVRWGRSPNKSRTTVVCVPLGVISPGTIVIVRHFLMAYTEIQVTWGTRPRSPNPSPGHVSNVSIKQLLYPGWNGKSDLRIPTLVWTEQSQKCRLQREFIQHRRHARFIHDYGRMRHQSRGFLRRSGS